MLEYVMNDLPMDQGFAYISWLLENDGWLQFSGLKRKGDGYVKRRVKEFLSKVGIKLDE